MTGFVRDASGLGVDAAVVTLSRTAGTPILAKTDRSGRFTVEAPPGTYAVSVASPLFEEESANVELASDRTAELNIALRVRSVTTEVTVAAETSRIEPVDRVPQSVNLIGRERLLERFSTVLTEAVREEPGLAEQRTSPSMGGLFVRGLTGKHVAVYRDGVRYTTSAQRGGVSTFLTLNEPHHLSGMEVLRGPDSAQANSDALGGTLHLLSRSPEFSETGFDVHGEASATFVSSSMSPGGSALLSLSSSRVAVLTSFASRRLNNVRTGGGIDSHAAVTRFLGLPSEIFGTRLPGTGVTQYGGMMRAQFATGSSSQIVAHYERGQQDGGQRYDQLLGGDGNLIADVRNLMLDFGYLRYNSFAAGPFEQASITASYNAQREERINQGGSGNPTATIGNQYERANAKGLSGYVTRNTGGHGFLFGGDAYRERMDSYAFGVSPVSGRVSPARPRVADGARYLLYGAYLQDVWQPFTKLRISASLRYGGASYEARTFIPDDHVAVRAWSGRAAAVYHPVSYLRLHAQFSRGFRAPNMTDLGSVGLQGNGFFEIPASAATGLGATVGSRADDQAVSSGKAVQPLQPETANNYEAGAGIRASRFKASIIGFTFDLLDVLASQTLILPAGAVGQILIDQPITQQLATGAVFVPAATAPVLVRANLRGMRSYGLEHTLEVRVTRRWSFAENFTWAYARDLNTGLPPDIEGGTPPPTFNARIRYAGRRFWAELYGTAADRQQRLSSLALADRRTGASRARGNIANFFANGARVRGLITPDNRLALTGETLAQVQNRVLGSAASAPMFLAVPGYGILGLRGGWELTERSTVFVDASNMLDKNYRGMSWGIDAPGRSITVRLQRRF